MEINTNMSVLPLQTRQKQAVNLPEMRRSSNRTDERVTQSVQQQGKQKEDKEMLEDIVSSMQETVKVMQRNLNFSIHDTTGMTVVKVMDAGSGEVIRQMPTEEALKLAERLDEMRSLLFEARA